MEVHVTTVAHSSHIPPFLSHVGLFVADQQLNNNRFGYKSARVTRQNPNGNRRGYECPEERDYYPYWHPTPWIDIAVFADNSSQCEWYRSQSFNVQPRGICRQRYPGDNTVRQWSRYNNRDDCEINGGELILISS